MLPRVRFGRTGLEVTRLGLGGYPFGGVNRARGWDPFTREGREKAIRTIHAALDAGITIIDTAPGYGEGNSEAIVGEALAGRRERVVLTTKVAYETGAGPATAEQLAQSVEASLRRLKTDHVEVLQFHGGMYTEHQVERILNGGQLAALEALRKQGKARFLGFTVEEPWTAKPLIASGRFDVMQVRYNLIYQSAALHVLDEARARDMGVSVMRPMTSGMLQRIARELAAGWAEEEIYALALRFVLADSRVHVANVGMRWPEEVARNAALAEGFRPSFDMAKLPRLTAGIYQSEDEGRG